MKRYAKDNIHAALAATSTLKRVLGIPNHSSQKDSFEQEILHIYTPDEQSALLIGELLNRYANGNQQIYYDAHPEIHTIRETLTVKPLNGGGFEICMAIPLPISYAEAISKMVAKFISPDRSLLR